MLRNVLAAALLLLTAGWIPSQTAATVNGPTSAPPGQTIWMHGGTKRSVTASETLRLYCRLATVVGVQIQWRRTDSSGAEATFDERRTTISEITKSLKIRNVQDHDAGRYWCVLMDAQSETALNKTVNANTLASLTTAHADVTVLPAPPAPDFVILDCYQDEGVTSSRLQLEEKDMTKRMQQDTKAIEPRGCIKACLKKGHRYAGMRNQSQCWCGDKVNGPKVSEKCEYCRGDRKMRCGGRNQVAVYYTPEVPVKVDYVGCHDHSSRPGAQDKAGAGWKTLPMEYNYVAYRNKAFRQGTGCAQVCLDHDKKNQYAGISSFFWCYCGYELPKTPASTACVKCEGNKSQQCGARTSLSVFKIPRDASSTNNIQKKTAQPLAKPLTGK